MNKVEEFIDSVGNYKFRTYYRESMYFKIRDNDKSELFKGLSELFFVAFAIGYYFDRKKCIAPKSVNHVNLVSFDREIKELIVNLILKRSPEIVNPKDLWKLVGEYAEYGIGILYNVWKENNVADISKIL